MFTHDPIQTIRDIRESLGSIHDETYIKDDVLKIKDAVLDLAEIVEALAEKEYNGV